LNNMVIFAVRLRVLLPVTWGFFYDYLSKSTIKRKMPAYFFQEGVIKKIDDQVDMAKGTRRLGNLSHRSLPFG
jgi:hypothetical protein